MKFFKSQFLCFFLVLALSNCKERELSIPQSDEQQEEGVIDLIAKPSDVTFAGDYDYGYIIKWPNVNEKIAKVVVKYTDKDNETRTMEFTDFKKDYSFAVQEFDEYTFLVQAFDKEGKSSRVAVLNAWNKDKYVHQLLNEASITQFGKFIRLRWTNVLNRDLKMTVKSSLINEVLQLKGMSGELFFPIVDNGQPDLNITLLDKETELEGNKSFAYRPQGINITRDDKNKWTLFSDSPFNDQGWWNLGESFDGEYTRTEDLDGMGKLNAVAIPNVTKLNADRRIRTLYFTFTQRRLNDNMGASIFNPTNRRPVGPYDFILVQRLTYVFKGPTDSPSGSAHDAIWPSQLRVFGVKPDGTEVLIDTVTNVESKLIKYKPDDGDFIKALEIDVPQLTFDGATFRGIKTEFSSSILGNDNDSWNTQNNIGLGEVYVTGIKASI